MALELEPAASAVPPALREMKGPGALGGGWRRFWALTWMVAVTEFRLTYFGSVLGYVWTLMRPLLMFGVYYVVFTQIVKVGGDIKHYPALLLTNIMLYQFFSQATTDAVLSVVARENLVRKMQFPRMVIPLAVVGTALMNLALNLVVVLVFALFNGVEVRWTWLLLPLTLVPLIMLSTGLAMLLAGAYVKYRDVQPVWAVVTQALFYASPIFYTIETPPESIRSILELNPLTGIIEGTRYLLIDADAPGGISAWGGWLQACIPLGTIVILFFGGLYYYHRQASVAAELL